MGEPEPAMVDVSVGLQTILEQTGEVVRLLTALDDHAALDEDTAPVPIASHIEVITKTLNEVCLRLHQEIDEAPECARLSKAPYALRLAQENIREAIALQNAQPE